MGLLDQMLGALPGSSRDGEAARRHRVGTAALCDDRTPFEEDVSVRRQRATVDRVTPDVSSTDPAMIRRDAS